ncbi:tobamovirus multiplication protein 2A-like [Nymphaea colorata]|nr:tobamovirus multiplication protein 2A-like [Nymphaea colorata]XP_031503606.1 tobamovirus multiplication protein 2A-like [Nymphaea colorata]XP_031503607.1 tobamovirus multiplication protein 2A-like [Nymphaea colorata]XP_031503608.1 tobamovirus multiplication protein 2A-like [Nymphaea colorata]XP_031503609.1 tobamovirus multiplication protein 2A-like [Nymphaea colorata]
MACRGFWECLLKLLNFLLTLAGLAMVGYGIYLFVEWNRSLDGLSPMVGESLEKITLGRPLLMSVSLSDSILDKLPKAWFIYLFIGIGVILFIVSVFGCIGLATRHSCCLSCYAVLVLFLILVELAFAAFIFFDHNWEDDIPTDSTGDFDMIYDFLKDNWKIARWVALGIVILEAFTFLLALVVRAANSPGYDSDDEYIFPRSGIRQPFIGRQALPATGVPVPAAPDQRIGRNDAWSARMREKYGLDTAEFTYKPTDSNRYQQQFAPPTEERRSRCTIM